MPQLIKIKNRIKSIESTLKITKAMKITAAARFIKSKERTKKIIFIQNSLKKIIERLNLKKLIKENLLCKKKENGNIIYVIFTTDRGFCGNFNLKLLHYSTYEYYHCFNKEKKNKIQFIPIGQKSIDFFEKNKNIFKLSKKNLYIWEENLFEQSNLIFNELKDFYIRNCCSKLYLVYNEFVNSLVQNPIKKQLFPLILENAKNNNKKTDYLLEPNKVKLIETILPFIFKLNIFKALIDTKAGEYASRMTSMEGANINGEKLIRKLKIQFQRARQELITKDLSELIGGVECLKKN